MRWLQQFSEVANDLFLLAMVEESVYPFFGARWARTRLPEWMEASDQRRVDRELRLFTRNLAAQKSDSGGAIMGPREVSG